MVKNVSQGRIKAISKRTFSLQIVERSFNPLELQGPYRPARRQATLPGKFRATIDLFIQTEASGQKHYLTTL